MTTVQLTDAQLAQFTACGVIVVDGELCRHDHTIHNSTGDIVGSTACISDTLVAPELWRKLTEPCATCGGTGVLYNSRFAQMAGAPVSSPCPDCAGGLQVITLTATCPKCRGTGLGKLLHDFGNGGPIPQCWDCDDGVVTLGRFTIRLLPVVSDDDYEADHAAIVIDDGTAYLLDDEGGGQMVRLDPLPQPGQFGVEVTKVMTA